MRLPPARRGSDHPRAKLTPAAAQAIRQEKAAGASLRQLADEHEVSYETVRRVVIRASYLD